MAYVQQSDLAGIIPAEFLTQALDDTCSGESSPSVWAQIQIDVGTAIDGILGTRFAVPFLPDPVTGLYPAFIVEAAKKLAAEQIYLRRGVAEEKNPWSKQCDSLRALMMKMAAGTAPLDPSLNRKDPSASIVTQPMRSAPRHGDRLSV